MKILAMAFAVASLSACDNAMAPNIRPEPADATTATPDALDTPDGNVVDGNVSIDGSGISIDGGSNSEYEKLVMLGHRANQVLQDLETDAIAAAPEFMAAVTQFNARLSPADMADVLQLLKDLHTGTTPDEAVVTRLLERYSDLPYFSQLSTQTGQLGASAAVYPGLAFTNLEPTCSQSCDSQAILPTMEEFGLFALAKASNVIKQFVNFTQVSLLVVDCLTNGPTCNADFMASKVVNVAIGILSASVVTTTNAPFAAAVAAVTVAKFVIDLKKLITRTITEATAWMERCVAHQLNECPITLSDGCFTWVCKNCVPLENGGLGSAIRLHFKYTGILVPDSAFEFTTVQGDWNGTITANPAEITAGYAVIPNGLWFGGPTSDATHQMKYLTHISSMGVRSNTISIYVPREDAD